MSSPRLRLNRKRNCYTQEMRQDETKTALKSRRKRCAKQRPPRPHDEKTQQSNNTCPRPDPKALCRIQGVTYDQTQVCT